MDRSDFTEAMPGTLVHVNGPQDARIAFVPAPLPPAWKWPSDLYPLLIRARTALATLDGTGKHLPDATILLHPLQAREAQLSSKLEGTITNPEQQVLFQADPTHSRSPDDQAFREVWNYRRALRLRLDGHNDLPLSLRLIRQLHEVLMEGVRGVDQDPGNFRRIQNQIDRPARFVPPPPERLSDILGQFENYLHDTSEDFDPLVKAFLVHYQFETIHPFRDGNGRVGRLLLALAIAEWCNLSSQWLYMSPYFETNRTEYIRLLFRVSTHGEWDNWLRFCLEGVVQQSLDAQQRCDALLNLYRDFHERIAHLRGGSVRLSQLVDNLFESPVVSVAFHRRQANVTYPTARADLDKLKELDILQALPGRTPITYFCRQIFNITYD